jgi:hypothetical protein
VAGQSLLTRQACVLPNGQVVVCGGSHVERPPPARQHTFMQGPVKPQGTPVVMTVVASTAALSARPLSVEVDASATAASPPPPELDELLPAPEEPPLDEPLELLLPAPEPPELPPEPLSLSDGPVSGPSPGVAGEPGPARPLHPATAETLAQSPIQTRSTRIVAS